MLSNTGRVFVGKWRDTLKWKKEILLDVSVLPQKWWVDEIKCLCLILNCFVITNLTLNQLHQEEIWCKKKKKFKKINKWISGNRKLVTFDFSAGNIQGGYRLNGFFENPEKSLENTITYTPGLLALICQRQGLRRYLQTLNGKNQLQLTAAADSRN